MRHFNSVTSKLAKSFLVILAALIFQSCSYNVNISRNPEYSGIIKRDLVTKRSLNLYPIDYNMNSYRDRHELGTWMLGVPLIGVIQPGHHVYFERAIRRDGFNQPGLENLNGYLIYKDINYPISYSVGAPSDNAARKKQIERNFEIVTD